MKRLYELRCDKKWNWEKIGKDLKRDAEKCRKKFNYTCRTVTI